VIGHAVGAKIILVQYDHASGRLGQPVLGVRRIIVVRGNRPAAVLERDFERSGGPRFFIVLDHLERLRRVRILEFGEEKLALIHECFWSDAAR